MRCQEEQTGVGTLVDVVDEDELVEVVVGVYGMAVSGTV